MLLEKKKIIVCLIILMVVGLFVMFGCAGEKDVAKPEKITVTLDWAPNTNHTGLYVAQAKGFYEDEGLEAEIIQLSGGTVEHLLATGRSHFGVSYQEAITYARLNAIPVVSIAAVIQDNTSGFASLESKNIKTPKDFEGKRYGGWGSPVEAATIKALMDRYDADFDKVEIMTTGAVDFFAASEKEADFFWIFYGWDGVAAELRGIGLNYIPLKDVELALNYYTPVLATSEALINKNPDLVGRFIRATSKGYSFAMENPEEAAYILLEAAPELDEELVVASQIWLKDKYQATAETWGLQQIEVWENYARWLYEKGLIDAELDTDKAFTNDFLK